MYLQCGQMYRSLCVMWLVPRTKACLPKEAKQLLDACNKADAVRATRLI